MRERVRIWARSPADVSPPPRAREGRAVAARGRRLLLELMATSFVSPCKGSVTGPEELRRMRFVSHGRARRDYRPRDGCAEPPIVIRHRVSGGSGGRGRQVSG